METIIISYSFTPVPVFTDATVSFEAFKPKPVPDFITTIPFEEITE